MAARSLIRPVGLEGTPVDYFGTDLATAVRQWWSETFLAEVEKKFPGASLAVVLLRSDVAHDWRDPGAADSVLLELRHGDGDTDQLVANIHHKLHFTLRTGLDSIHARRNPHLIEAGDFPHGGAVSHRGFFGGVSGLVEESDAWLAQQVIDQLVTIRARVAKSAVAASLAGAPGWSYLPNEIPPA